MVWTTKTFSIYEYELQEVRIYIYIYNVMLWTKKSITKPECDAQWTTTAFDVTEYFDVDY